MTSEELKAKLDIIDGSIIDRISKASLALTLAQEAWAVDPTQNYVVEGMRDAQNQLTQILKAVGLPNVWAWGS